MANQIITKNYQKKKKLLLCPKKYKRCTNMKKNDLKYKNDLKSIKKNYCKST